jgi:hypothetical protein
MGKTGFGTFKGFSAMWSMDHTNDKVPPFDFIAYPSPGFFPLNYFAVDRPWSITLSEDKYAPPSEKTLTLTMTPVEVQIAQNKLSRSAQPCKIAYLHVDLGGYAIPNCIIFRPANLRTDNGATYLVEAGGLKNNRGQATTLKYVVAFFKP